MAVIVASPPGRSRSAVHSPSTHALKRTLRRPRRIRTLRRSPDRAAPKRRRFDLRTALRRAGWRAV